MPSITRVWPALWPPWKRTTMSACSDSQSTILPLPSSPHWEPTTTTFAMRTSSPRQRPDTDAGCGRPGPPPDKGSGRRRQGGKARRAVAGMNAISMACRTASGGPLGTNRSSSLCRTLAKASLMSRACRETARKAWAVSQIVGRSLRDQNHKWAVSRNDISLESLTLVTDDAGNCAIREHSPCRRSLLRVFDQKGLTPASARSLSSSGRDWGRAIAEQLGMAYFTLRKHRLNILRKLGLTTAATTLRRRGRDAGGGMGAERRFFQANRSRLAARQIDVGFPSSSRATAARKSAVCSPSAR